MKRLALTLVALLLFATSGLAAEYFPNIELKGDVTSETGTYLGIGNDKPTISDIKADYLFVEVYSLYCPICQRDAPEVNALFEAVKKERDNVKFVGIGAGNTAFEVMAYRRKFEVLFPLFEDPDYVCHKALGGYGTPSFYLIDLKGDREVLFFQEGVFKNKEELLKIILEKTQG